MAHQAFRRPGGCIPLRSAEKLEEISRRENAIPYDTKGAELGHHRDKCSFDAIMEKYKLTDPALAELSKIIRAADTNRLDLAPESIGLEAIASGSMMIAKSDHEAIEKQSYVYDSLYAYCKRRLLEKRYAREIEQLGSKQKLEFLRVKVSSQAEKPEE